MKVGTARAGDQWSYYLVLLKQSVTIRDRHRERVRSAHSAWLVGTVLVWWLAGSGWSGA